MSAKDDLKEEAERVALYQKLGLAAKIENSKLGSQIRVLELARHGLELAEIVEATDKRERWLPERWSAFYLGAAAMDLLHWLTGV